MIDKFKEIPETEQGIRLYIIYANKELKSMERKAKSLEKCIQEANNRLEAKNGRLSTDVSSKA